MPFAINKLLIIVVVSLSLCACSEKKEGEKTTGQKFDQFVESTKEKLDQTLEKTKTDVIDGAKKKIDDAHQSTQEYLDRSASNLRKDELVDEATGENEKKPEQKESSGGLLDNVKGQDRASHD